MEGGAGRFRVLGLAQRLRCVREEGEYLGSRMHGGYQVHLYRMDGFFCEVWMRRGLGWVEWVEVATNDELLTEYVRFNPRDLLGDT